MWYVCGVTTYSLICERLRETRRCPINIVEESCRAGYMPHSCPNSCLRIESLCIHGNARSAATSLCFITSVHNRRKRFLVKFLSFAHFQSDHKHFVTVLWFHFVVCQNLSSCKAGRSWLRFPAHTTRITLVWVPRANIGIGLIWVPWGLWKYFS